TLIASFSSRVLRCSGALIMVASIIWPHGQCSSWHRGGELDRSTIVFTNSALASASGTATQSWRRERHPPCPAASPAPQSVADFHATLLPRISSCAHSVG